MSKLVTSCQSSGVSYQLSVVSIIDDFNILTEN
jgi:hypothetical protein